MFKPSGLALPFVALRKGRREPAAALQKFISISFAFMQGERESSGDGQDAPVGFALQCAGRDFSPSSLQKFKNYMVQVLLFDLLICAKP